MKMLWALGNALLATFEGVGQFAGARLLLEATVGLAAAWIVRALAGSGGGAKESPRDDRSQVSARRRELQPLSTGGSSRSTASTPTPASPRPPNR